jgi:hypothetical protein
LYILENNVGQILLQRDQATQDSVGDLEKSRNFQSRFERNGENSISSIKVSTRILAPNLTREEAESRNKAFVAELPTLLISENTEEEIKKYMSALSRYALVKSSFEKVPHLVFYVCGYVSNRSRQFRDAAFSARGVSLAEVADRYAEFSSFHSQCLFVSKVLSMPILQNEQ